MYNWAGISSTYKFWNFLPETIIKYDTARNLVSVVLYIIWIANMNSVLTVLETNFAIRYTYYPV